MLSSISPPYTVLIETLWNVKTVIPVYPVVNPIVLIETLWNVKMTSFMQYLISLSGINRNIVECKVEKKRTRNGAG